MLIKFIKFVVAWFRIPRGPYCYTIKETIRDPSGQNPLMVRSKVCPYWEIRRDLPRQVNGYCRYLDITDEENNNNPDSEFICTVKGTGEKRIVKAPDMPFGTSLLWDQCKECGIKED